MTYFFMILVLSALFPFVSFANFDDKIPLPQDQPACQRTQANAQKLQSALLNPELPSACRNQLEESYKRCAGLALINISPVKDGASVSEYSKRAQIFSQNSDRFLTHAGICVLENEKVSAICTEMGKDLRIARNQNGQARAQELRNVSGGLDGSQTTGAVYKRYNEVSNQLTEQLGAAGRMTVLANEVFSDKADCLGFHQVFASKVSEGIELEISGYAPEENLKDDANIPGQNKSNWNAKDLEIAKKAKDDLRDEVLTYALQKKYGRDLAAYISYNYGRKSLIAMGARELASTAVTTTTRVWTGVTTYLALVSPAGTPCNEIKVLEDPLKAEAQGCEPGIKMNRD